MTTVRDCSMTMYEPAASVKRPPRAASVPLQQPLVTSSHGTGRSETVFSEPVISCAVCSLCRTILHDCSLPRTWEIGEVHYFTAFAYHMEARSPGGVDRHKTLIRALEDQGVRVHLGQFKQRPGTVLRWEEKETDVAIAVHMFPTPIAVAMALKYAVRNPGVVYDPITRARHPRPMAACPPGSHPTSDWASCPSAASACRPPRSPRG